MTFWVTGFVVPPFESVVVQFVWSWTVLPSTVGSFEEFTQLVDADATVVSENSIYTKLINVFICTCILSSKYTLVLHVYHEQIQKFYPRV